MFRIFAAFSLLLLTAVALPSSAQEAGGVLQPADYENWAALAERAEDVVDRGAAATSALEVLRQDLSGWRARFRAAQSANEARLAGLREQIAALGPVSETDQATSTEAVQIEELRTQLTAELQAAEAPVRRATAAFQRAEGLIGEVDQLLQDRQTRALLEVEPSIANPVHWWPALDVVHSFGFDVWDELSAPFASETSREAQRDNLPAIALFSLLAILTLARSRLWIGMIMGWFNLDEPAETGAGRRLTALILDAARIMIPVVGLWAIGQAMVYGQMSGLRISALSAAAPMVGVVVLMALWLGARTFRSGASPLASIMELSPVQATGGARQVALLGAAFAIWLVLSAVAEVDRDVAQYLSVYSAFPIILAGLALMRLGQILLSGKDLNTDETLMSERFIKLISRAVIATGLLAPALSLIGYANASAALIWPVILTLGLLILVHTAQMVLVDLYKLLRHGPSYAVSGSVEIPLYVTLLTVMLALLSVPIFALIWGVRWAQLTELWQAFVAGVSIGDTVISPTVFLTFAVIFSGGYMATRLIQSVLRSSVLPKTKLDSGGRDAIVAGTGYVGVILSAIVAITGAGLNLSGLAIVAGALSVGIGFGLQTIVSNFVSGIILLIERPIKVGDWISVSGTSGYVRAISVRSTRIETFDRQDVIVPNADLISGAVTNYTLSNTTGRLIVPVGVAYGSDTRQVERVLLEIAKAHPMVILNPAPAVVFQGFGADSMDFEIRAILRDVNWVLSTKSDMNHEIAKAFAEHGIEIPFMQRDIWIRNPEAMGIPQGT